jgi:ATP-dependent DNA helicase RecG
VSFDRQAPQAKALRFDALESQFKEKLALERLSDDALKCLGLMDRHGYNNIAELLADENAVSASIFEIQSFARGFKYSAIKQKSLITQFYWAMELFEEAYRSLGGECAVPKKAFREAVANAILYRDYRRVRPISIKLARDCAVIRSPGGLPDGISEVDYAQGSVAFLRNMTLADIFYKLRIIERYGSGVRFILDEYKNFSVRPYIAASDEEIVVRLPSVVGAMSKEANAILNLLCTGRAFTRNEIARKAGFASEALEGALASLERQKMLTRIGSGLDARFMRSYE